MKEPGELDILIETFKLRSSDHENDVIFYIIFIITFKLFGENKKIDRLIIMDDVSGVADVFNSFNKIWISLHLCLSCHCSIYANFAKNNLPN